MRVEKSHSFKKSIFLLDLLKCYAVIAMIFGHTLSQYLSKNSPYLDSIAGELWQSMRYFTAPIFLFASGVIYTKVAFKFDQKKKLINIFLITVIAYGMHIPIFSGSTKEFYRVDILHLFSFLFLINFFIFRMFKSYLKVVLAIIILSLILFYEYFYSDNFDSLHPLIANYFLPYGNSFFPIYPYAVYFFAGNYLGLIPNLFKINQVKLSKFNSFIIFISRNSFWFYVVHLLILYGDISFIGVGTFFEYYSLNIYYSIFLFFIIFILSFLLIYLFKKVKWS